MSAATTTRLPKADAMFSPSGADFEAFPPTVKRKYFSTLERLRYAQGQLPLEPFIPPVTATATTATTATAANMNVFRPKSAGTPKHKSVHTHTRRPSLFHLRSSPRNVKEQIPETPGLDLGLVSQQDALFYQNLPEKIKRIHLPYEERHAWSRNEAAASEVADEQLFYRVSGGRYGNKSVPSLTSCSEPGSAREEVLQTPMDMVDAVFETFRLLDNEQAPDTGLDDYHTHVAEAANVAKITSPRRHDPVRTLGLTSVISLDQRASLERTTTVDATNSFQTGDLPPALPPSPLHLHARSFSRPLPPPGPFNRPVTPKRPSILERRSLKRASSFSDVPPVPPIDPEAAHVNDPATRLKLKLYLSSAARFDEALEFGFPSTSATTPSQVYAPSSRPSTSSYVDRRRSRSLGPSSSSVRRSLSASRNTARESVAIGTTFFYDEYDSEDECGHDTAEVDTVRDSCSMNNAGMESDGTVVEYESSLGVAELPAELPGDLLADAVSLKPTLSAHSESVSITSSAYRASLSRSVSLRPRHKAGAGSPDTTNLPPLPQSAKDFTARGYTALRSPQTPLKTWVEPEPIDSHREMTLRLTLTRQDLRADDSLIYPDGGAGSWDSQNAHRDVGYGGREVSHNGKWRFWSKRKS